MRSLSISKKAVPSWKNTTGKTEQRSDKPYPSLSERDLGNHCFSRSLSSGRSSGKYCDITAKHLEGTSKPHFTTIGIQPNLRGPWCTALKGQCAAYQSHMPRPKPRTVDKWPAIRRMWCVHPVLAAGRYVSFFMHDTGNIVSFSAYFRYLELYVV